MMTIPNHVLLRANWGGRPGTLETEIDAVWDYMRRLAGYGRFLDVPWYYADLRRIEMLASKEALGADMMRTRESGDGPHYSFTQDTFQRVNNPPHASLTATLSYPDATSGLKTANQVVVGLETTVVRSKLPVDVACWLLSLGSGFVRDMVDVWCPDVVSLDSPEIVGIRGQLGVVGAFPVIGFVSWLSDVVIDSKDVPKTPIREPYKNGMLFGVDPDSKDPVGDATELAVRLYSSGKLRPIPDIQGQPATRPEATFGRRGLFGGRS